MHQNPLEQQLAYTHFLQNRTEHATQQAAPAIDISELAGTVSLVHHPPTCTTIHAPHPLRTLRQEHPPPPPLCNDSEPALRCSVTCSTLTPLAKDHAYFSSMRRTKQNRRVINSHRQSYPGECVRMYCDGTAAHGWDVDVFGTRVGLGRNGT